MRPPLSRTATAFGTATLFSAAVALVAWQTSGRAAAERALAALPPLVQQALAMPAARWEPSASRQSVVRAVDHRRAAVVAARMRKRADVERVRAERAAAEKIADGADAEFAPALRLAYVRIPEQFCAVAGGPPEPPAAAAPTVESHEVRAPARPDATHALTPARWDDSDGQAADDGGVAAQASDCRGGDLRTIAVTLDPGGQFERWPEIYAEVAAHVCE